MSKGGLAFLNKKSWHTSTIRNIERVWKAERAEKAEQKRLLELQKERQQERQVEELRRLQNDSGIQTQEHTDTRGIEWMYHAPTQGTSTEEYLTGSAQIKDEASDVKRMQTEGVSGALFLDKTKSTVRAIQDAETRVNEDPLMQVLKTEKAMRDSILKHPGKVKKLYDDVKLMKQIKKLKKLKKKEEKRAKKAAKRAKKKGRKRASRSRSRSASPEYRHKRARSSSPPRSPKREPSPRSSRRRQRSPTRNRRRSRTPPRDAVKKEQSPPRKRRRSRTPPRSSRRRSASPPSKRSPSPQHIITKSMKAQFKQFGLQHPLGDKSTAHLIAEKGRENKDRKEIKRESSPRREKDTASYRQRSRRPAKLSKEDKARNLREMRQNADAYAKSQDDSLRRRRKEKMKSDQEQREHKGASGGNPEFLNDERKKHYLETHDSLEDRVKKRSHYRQKGDINSKRFL